MVTLQQRKMMTTSRVQVIRRVDLEGKLWKEPFLKNHEERSAVSKIVIGAIGIQFLKYFNRGRVPTTSIIESLKITDQAYVEKVFYEWINLLCASNNSIDQKFHTFQNICNSYSRAGIDVFKLLKSEFLEESLPIIQKWYASAHLFDTQLNITRTLLNALRCFFNEKRVDPQNKRIKI